MDETTARIQIIAHRGASAEAPENTLAAFEKALEIGVDWIELDIHFTADGQAVVVHDDTLERVAMDQRRIADLTWGEASVIDVGSWFDEVFYEETLPSLESVLTLCLDKAGVMVEVKADGPIPLLAQQTAQLLKKFTAKGGQIAVGSFSSALLAALHVLSPEIPLLGIAETAEELDHHLALPLQGLVLDANLFLAQKQLLPAHLPLWIFTIDDPLLAQKLVLLSVQGIITNDPRKLKNSLGIDKKKHS